MDIGLTLSLARRSVLNPASDAVQGILFRLAYVVRGRAIRWCLAFANFLERRQARAITRAASEKGLGLPPGVTIPAPTFPERGYFPLPRDHSHRFLELPVIQVSESELRYEDFDDALTSVRQAIATIDAGPRT